MRRHRLALTGFIVLFAAGCSSSATIVPSASTGPSAVVSIEPSTAPASVAPSSPAPTDSKPSSTPSNWQPVRDQPAASETQLSDVVWTGSRFVAAGVDANDAAVFVDSTDGLVWNLQPALGADAHVRGLTFSAAGIVAVGARGVGGRQLVLKGWADLDVGPGKRGAQTRKGTDDSDERRHGVCCRLAGRRRGRHAVRA